MPARIKLTDRAGRRKGLELTALVDCVFLLLVFFLLTSTYTRQKQLDVDLQAVEAGTSLAGVEAAVGVEINSGGEIFLNGQLVSRQDLGPKLLSAVEHDLNHPIEIRADKAAPAGVLLSVLDAARGKGLNSVRLIGVGRSSEQIDD